MDLPGYLFVRREIGDQAVYPGHAVTLGLLIMRAFPNLQAASDRGPNEKDFTAARWLMATGTLHPMTS